MFRSIRWTLQLWYGAILAVALGSLVAVMDFRSRRAELQRIEAELEGAAQTLLAGPDFSENPAHDVRDPSRPEELEWARRMGLDYSGTGVFSDVWWKVVPANAIRRLQQGPEQPYYVVWSESGRVLRASSDDLPVPSGPGVAEAIAAAVAKVGTASFIVRPDVREVVIAEAGRYPMRVLVGKSIKSELRALDLYWLGVAGTGGLILLVGLIGGWFLIGRALKPIDEISAAAQSISGSDLSRRISVDQMKTELASLASTLNAAFARLEAAFERQLQFTADASHELRTPLAVVNSHAEIALGKPRTEEEYRRALEVCHRAGRRMGALVESLLVHARIDGKQIEVKPTDFDLRECVDECLELLSDQIDERRIVITPLVQSCPVCTDRTLILRVVTNLLTNAIHYNRDGGSIRIVLKADATEAVLEIADTGVGIAPEDQARLFERFFRADKTRSTAAGGVGLGLSMSHGIVTYLGGTISFSSEIEVGTTFTVRLPTGTKRAAGESTG